MPRPPARRPTARRTLPTYALYGEAGASGLSMLHVESIQSRSRLYRWEIDVHVHHGLHQLLWVQAGPVASMLDDSRADGRGPLAIVIPPGVAHAFRFSAASEGHVLTFDARLLGEGEPLLGQALAQLFGAPRRLAVPPHEAARVQALLSALLVEHDAADPGPVSTWLARAAVWRLAAVAARDASAAPRARRDGGAQAHYTRWVALMEAHYREHWPVTRYAERLGLSAERLNRLLRAETGMSAMELLHARLVREACRRLVHVAAPVSNIAFELGFEDPAYFCRFFRRHVGVAPRAWRARAGQPG